MDADKPLMAGSFAGPANDENASRIEVGRALACQEAGETACPTRPAESGTYAYFRNNADPNTKVVPRAFSNRTMSLNDGVSRRSGESSFLPLFDPYEAAVGKWESCFWISTFPRRSSSRLWECGNRAFGDFQGLWET